MIRVLGRRVLVVGESLQRYHSEVIALPETYNTEPMRHGEVSAVGPDVDNIKPRDVVFFHENAGHTMRLDETVYIVLDEDDLLGYSPDVMEVSMPEDTEVKALRDETANARNATAEAKRATQELEEAMERAGRKAEELKKATPVTA